MTINIKTEAEKYIAGWDSYECIELTAEKGLSDEDARRLAEHYGDEAGAIGDEIVRLCRERVAAE